MHTCLFLCAREDTFSETDVGDQNANCTASYLINGALVITMVSTQTLPAGKQTSPLNQVFLYFLPFLRSTTIGLTSSAHPVSA